MPTESRKNVKSKFYHNQEVEEEDNESTPKNINDPPKVDAKPDAFLQVNQIKDKTRLFSVGEI